MLKRILCTILTIIFVVTTLNVGLFDAHAEGAPATKVVLGTADGKGIELNADTPVYLDGEGAIAVPVPNGVHPAHFDLTDPANPVLYIEGLKIDGYYLDPLQAGIAYGIYANGNLTIRIDGRNEITNSYSDGTLNYGIKSNGSITFESDTDGALYASCKKAVSTYGVEAAGISVTGGVLIFESEGASGESFGVRSSEGIDVSGGVLTAKGGTVDGTNYPISYGIYSSGKFVQSAGTVVGEGGDVTAGAEYSTNSYGIYASGMEVTGGEMTGTGGCANSQSVGINIYSSEPTALTVSGGSVSGTGGMVNGDLVGSMDGTVQGRMSYGIVNFTGSVSVEGGELVAKGGPTKDKNGLSHGIYYGTALEISGGSILAESNTEAVGGYSFMSMEGGLPTLSAMHYRYRLQTGDELLYVNDGREFVAWYSPFTEIICGEFDGEPLPPVEPTTEPTDSPTDGSTEGPTICPTPKVVKVKNVKFAKMTVKVKRGRKITLKVKLTPAKGLTKAAKKVKWSIDKKGKKIVKFVKKANKLNGKLKAQIKALKKGTAKVTCKAPSGKKAVCKIRVR